MKKLVLVMMVFIAFFLVTKCSNKESCNMFVYSHVISVEGTMFLYVDEKLLDSIPFIETVQSQDIKKSNALALKLEPGTHKISVKDHSQNVLSTSKIEIPESKSTNENNFSNENISYTNSSGNNLGLVFKTEILKNYIVLSLEK